MDFNSASELLQDHPKWSLHELVARNQDKLFRLYKSHVTNLTQKYEEYALQLGLEAVVIDAGVQKYYFADDRGVSFVPTPHFAHWLPLGTPGHVVVWRSGKKPLLCVYAPKDYWHEDPSRLLENGGFSIDGSFGDAAIVSGDLFEIKTFAELASLVAEVEQVVGSRKAALVGPLRNEFKKFSWLDNPPPLISRLDWNRTTKSEYELLCLWIAQCSGVRGHMAVHQQFMKGGVHELDLHLSFLQGTQLPEQLAPYGSIVALNERGRILHYQYKKTGHEPLFSLLIDAGSQFRGYPSDITRTYAGPRGSKAFRDLLKAVDEKQQDFVNSLVLGTSFVYMHEMAHKELANLLLEHEVLRGVSAEAAVAMGLTRVFFPHGLGHHLGLQVHDVGSKQLDPEGTAIKVSDAIPGGRYLRNIRPLDVGHVVTIEPGIYFIPMLLDEAFAGEHQHHFNKALIGDLMPHGGIRIEDDIYMSLGGPINLTRKAFEALFA